jgi:hypothetical protein
MWSITLFEIYMIINALGDIIILKDSVQRKDSFHKTPINPYSTFRTSHSHHRAT